MSAGINRRTVNPRLGTYFGIFASAFVAIVLLVLVLEQLGSAEAGLRLAMLLGPLVMVAGIGIACRSGEASEFFAAGRRVPAVYSGVAMAVTVIGGTGVVALTGLFFLHGYDIWCIGTGIVAGFVVMGVLIAPFLRKFGGYTVAAYLGRRFDSRLVRIVAAALLTVPMLLFLSAELSVAAAVAARLSGLPLQLSYLVVVVFLAVSLAPGGMRGATWMTTAQAIALLLAILVPAGLIAVLAGNLPVPQLSHGPTLRALGALERAHGIPVVAAPPLAFEIAGDELAAITQRFASPFGSIGPVAYILMTFTIMAGVAVAPWVLPRVGTTPGVYETRKSTGWATVAAGLIILTLSALAVFMRDIVVEQLAMKDPAGLPAWFGELVRLGLARIGAEEPRLPPTSFLFSRDGVLFALPIAASFPAALLYLAMAGAVAAAMAGASAVTMAIAATVAEDIVAGTSWQPLPDRTRLLLARIAIVAASVVGATIAMVTSADPFHLMLWAIAISGATAFPILTLSIWWKRVDEQGALVALIVGFSAAVLSILFATSSDLGLHAVLAGAVGIPASAAAALLVSALRGSPGKPELELLSEMRIPGGETFYDRETRRYRQQQRHVR